MQIQEAKFITSNIHYADCPHDNKPEIALIGRSNVGKSSLINMLLHRKLLAKTSRTPGKTQLINHFLINEQWYLVDLPGYGWAKVNHAQRVKWEKMSRNYLLYRKNLLCIFLLIDIRLPPQKIDLEFMKWLGNNEMPFHIVFTKIDKQSPAKTASCLAVWTETLQKIWDPLPSFCCTSSQKGIGREDLLIYIQKIIKKYKIII